MMIADGVVVTVFVVASFAHAIIGSFRRSIMCLFAHVVYMWARLSVSYTLDKRDIPIEFYVGSLLVHTVALFFLMIRSGRSEPGAIADFTCPICLEEARRPTSAAVCGNGHLVHAECNARWNGGCSICREPLMREVAAG